MANCARLLAAGRRAALHPTTSIFVVCVLWVTLPLLNWTLLAATACRHSVCEHKGLRGIKDEASMQMVMCRQALVSSTAQHSWQPKHLDWHQLHNACCILAAIKHSMLCPQWFWSEVVGSYCMPGIHRVAHPLSAVGGCLLTCTLPQALYGPKLAVNVKALLLHIVPLGAVPCTTAPKAAVPELLLQVWPTYKHGAEMGNNPGVLINHSCKSRWLCIIVSTCWSAAWQAGTLTACSPLLDQGSLVCIACTIMGAPHLQL